MNKCVFGRKIGQKCQKSESDCFRCQLENTLRYLQMLDMRKNLKKEDVDEKFVELFKRMHSNEEINKKFCKLKCPCYGFFCNSKKPDATKCIEKAEEILKENENTKVKE